MQFDLSSVDLTQIYDVLLGQPMQLAVALATLAALLIAVFQSHQSSKHEGILTDVASSISTRVISQFPAHLSTVSKLLAKAEKTIDIMCAFPEHAHFSNIEDYKVYESVVQSSLRDTNITVRMIFADASYRLLSDRRQFRKAGSNWLKWRGENTKQLKKYIEVQKDVAAGMSISHPEDIRDSEHWHEFQEACEQAAIKRWCATNPAAEIIEVPTFMPISIWTIDKKESVALISGQDEIVGHAFQTADIGLSKALLSLQNRYARGYASTQKVDIDD